MTWHWLIQKLISEKDSNMYNYYETLRVINKWLEYLSTFKEVIDELQYFQYYGSVTND